MRTILLRSYGRKVKILLPSLSLGYLATALKRRGHEVEIWDLARKPRDPVFLGRKLLEAKAFERGGSLTPIPGLSMRNGRGSVRNEPAFHSTLDDFGWPDWEKIHPEDF